MRVQWFRGHGILKKMLYSSILPCSGSNLSLWWCSLSVSGVKACHPIMLMGPHKPEHSRSNVWCLRELGNSPLCDVSSMLPRIAEGGGRARSADSKTAPRANASSSSFPTRWLNLGGEWNQGGSDNPQFFLHLIYRAQVISWANGSVCSILKFAFPHCSPPLYGVEISKQYMHWTFDPINNLTPVFHTTLGKMSLNLSVVSVRLCELFLWFPQLRPPRLTRYWETSKTGSHLWAAHWTPSVLSYLPCSALSLT